MTDNVHSMPAGVFAAVVMSGLLREPAGGADYRLGDYYVRIVRVSPKKKHVHFQVLGHHQVVWMPRRRFMLEAVVAPYFERNQAGELVWIEPATVFRQRLEALYGGSRTGDRPTRVTTMGCIHMRADGAHDAP